MRDTVPVQEPDAHSGDTQLVCCDEERVADKHVEGERPPAS
jgi:hypothetical protein